MRVPEHVVKENVRSALAEDIGTGDVHTILVVPGTMRKAHIITRSQGILCGQDWVNEVCHQMPVQFTMEWQSHDGDRLDNKDKILSLTAPAAGLLTVERTLLNFLQLLSGTATRVHEFVQLIAHTDAQILDTRKTIPGLRYAQKYAVTVGGGGNHRFGLYDAFLIKENHIISAGGITPALRRANQSNPELFLEIEVETMDELKEALSGHPNRIMLDNFSLADMGESVEITRKFDQDNNTTTELEASGQINSSNIVDVAETGVDFISLGTLTKDVVALDFSMRIEY